MRWTDGFRKKYLLGKERVLGLKNQTNTWLQWRSSLLWRKCAVRPKICRKGIIWTTCFCWARTISSGKGKRLLHLKIENFAPKREYYMKRNKLVWERKFHETRVVALWGTNSSKMCFATKRGFQFEQKLSEKMFLQIESSVLWKKCVVRKKTT